MSDSSGFISIAVRLFFGALGGCVIGLSWLWWLTPIDSPVIDWAVFGLAVVICGYLAVRMGDDFWENIFTKL